eukprot:11218430-Lingulodinium_polyedra.AAC.1
MVGLKPRDGRARGQIRLPTEGHGGAQADAHDGHRFVVVRVLRAEFHIIIVPPHSCSPSHVQ